MEKRQYKDIELRSEEVQEVMSKIPPGILRYGISVLATIIFVLLGGSAFFSYPEKFEAELTLTSKNPPVYIKTPCRGRIERLYVNNETAVKKGDILAVIENLANTEDMLQLRQSLNNWQAIGAKIEQIGIIFFQQFPRLGNVQGVYSSCLLSWKKYLQHMNDNHIYETELTNAVTQLSMAVKDWEKSYLLIAPTDGRVAFMQLWEQNQYVNADETVFVVSEPGSQYKGMALVPMKNANKIKIGQRAIVRTNGTSDKDYKFADGKVVSVSPVPNESGYYVMEVKLLNDTETINDKRFPMMNVITGTVEVIIKDKSLLEHLIIK